MEIFVDVKKENDMSDSKERKITPLEAVVTMLGQTSTIASVLQNIIVLDDTVNEMTMCTCGRDHEDDIENSMVQLQIEMSRAHRMTNVLNENFNALILQLDAIIDKRVESERCVN